MEELPSQPFNLTDHVFEIQDDARGRGFESIPQGHTIFLYGAPGTYKTSIAFQSAYSAYKKGFNVKYLLCEQNVHKFIEHARIMGLADNDFLDHIYEKIQAREESIKAEDVDNIKPAVMKSPEGHTFEIESLPVLKEDLEVYVDIERGSEDSLIIDVKNRFTKWIMDLPKNKGFVVIDSINSLFDRYWSKRYPDEREAASRAIDILRRPELTSLIIGERTSTQIDKHLAYQCDGVFSLMNYAGMNTVAIQGVVGKMRSVEYTRSPVLVSYNSNDNRFILAGCEFYYTTPDGNAYLRYDD